MVEATAIGAMVAITLVLTASRQPLAPAIGYAGAYGLVALTLLSRWGWRRSRHDHRVSAGPADPPS